MRSSRAASVASDGALRHGFLHGLEVFGAGMKEEMDVSVDEAGKKRAIAEIDDFGASRMLDRKCPLRQFVHPVPGFPRA
jgi:hypothetical protein